ncbi:hypothetical protein ONZ51_g13310 [Trametes cubensis]|uniref:Heterokaryon incompatibility domain-containing protein n=1 Tax=Trametes cubensis TaxID=1111947 RepID=A0AAD7TEL4_9APHY|nr:hypothetical protein ONZ51_g13310 [Trametes cubensis]
MWLLSTASLKLEEFKDTSQVKVRYAILSHVWQEDEKTFQHIRELQSKGVQTYEDQDVGSKIRRCINVAKSLGFEWLWIDTCCIDKTSSSELEESINSMFKWYAEADVCFAYLFDVPADCYIEAPQSEFWRSKWFTRGWTLQELIAPRQLIFMSAQWVALGTKAALADILEEITGVDAEILTFRRALQHVGVARRLSWASRRITSKVEDKAYSLMGLFDVTMPTIYGEGMKAFRRLQEEIMKRSHDYTLFAWGRTLSSVMPYSQETRRHKRDMSSRLFALSPSSFGNGTPKRARLTPIRLDAVKKIVSNCILVADLKMQVLREVTVTSYGVRCHLPVVHGKTFSIALLPCKNSAGECVGLLLWRNPDSRSDLPQYFVGASFQSVEGIDSLQGPHESTGYRLINIRPSIVEAILNFGQQSSNLSLSCASGSGNDNVTKPRKARASLEKIYIIDTLPSTFPVVHPWMHLSNSETCRILIPVWLLDYLDLFGFIILERAPASPILGESTALPCTLTLIHPRAGERITIHLGLHNQSHLCASVIIDSAVDGREGSSNASIDWSRPLYCPPDVPPQRIRDWTNGSKSFGDEHRTVRLTATRWPMDADCYHFEIRLKGTVYASLRSVRCLRPHGFAYMEEQWIFLRAASSGHSCVRLRVAPPHQDSHQPDK